MKLLLALAALLASITLPAVPTVEAMSQCQSNWGSGNTAVAWCNYNTGTIKWVQARAWCGTYTYPFYGGKAYYALDASIGHCPPGVTIRAHGYIVGY